MAGSNVVSCLRDVRPPIFKHAPSMWTHTFTNFSFDEQEQQKYAETIEELKQEVRGMLMATTTPLKQMMLIDTLERLGLAYHFETEIENYIEQINGAEDGVLQDNGLFAIALRFRLLRQHRHHVSCDVFNKFVDKDGKFEEALSRDHEGLLNLYEAAHVRFRGEIILKEAVKFTTHYLRRKKEELESPLKEKVKRALEHPLHWEFPIVSARIFISIYDKDDSRDELLLKLAKINFKFMQNVYRKDLSQLSRWWNKFDLKSKLPHARDRLAEAYLWGVGYNYEPEYSLVRIGLAKGIQIIATMDDTYDNYATVNEAQLFTEVLDKWNAEEAERLPEYMTILYHFILSISEDYERDAMKVGKSFATSYFIESVKQLARAYNQELKWIMEKQLPPFEDYLKNSEITSCVYLMFASIIPGLKSVTQETINWVKGEPKLARSTALVGRYADDIGSQHRESKEGKVFTSLDCYIKQHGVSKQETLSKYAELLEGEWEDLNKEFVATNSMPKEITITFLNYARMCDATYNKNNTDAYSDCDAAKTNIITLFVDDILI